MRALLISLKNYVKNSNRLKRVSLWAIRVLTPILHIVNVRAIPMYFAFGADLRKFRRAGGSAATLDFYPCLFDKTATSSIDAHYFYQAVWAFRKILAAGVHEHIDVGSQVNFVGLLTTITRVTFVDIRPLELSLQNYRGVAGSILSLPFETETIRSFSSLHVIEHVGLGRYGDPIDPQGSVRAAREVVRVLASGGHAYISVPIGRSRVQFNGQRVFAVAEVIDMFAGLDLIEMATVDVLGVFSEGVKPANVEIKELGSGSDFALGMFQFEKRGQ